MKKVILLFFIPLFILHFAFAEITIQTDQNIYNLGDKIKASASVAEDKSFEGLFKLTLSCGNYKLLYLLKPISLEANFRTAVNVDELPSTNSMLGNCTITGDLVTNDNLAVEEKESNSFGVTNQLIILPVKAYVKAFPGDTITVSGIVNEAYGNNVLKARTKIMLDNNSYEINAIDGKFNLTLELAKTIKSGVHEIGISASDLKNNVGNHPIQVEITAVPTYVKTELSSDNILPGTKIDITSSIYDQADDLINDSLNLDLATPKGDNVFKKVVQSHEKIDYEFSQHAEPGLYELTSTYKSLVNKASINITTIRAVNLKYENETVMIENTGNILFEDELTFFLESESKKYPIIKKIKIDPGKILGIDLSKEVPLGIYNVTLPFRKGIAAVKEKINETIEGLFQTQDSNANVLAADVTIHDNRPVYKKLASELSSISGSIVGSNGVLAKNPVIAPGVLIVIILVVAVRYGRKPIMRMIKGKKDEGEKKE